jgi:serine/threonine-protein kinase
MVEQQLGKYEILEHLGAGATADVFRALDTVLGREVALKVLKPSLVADISAFARFSQEAQAAAQLFHPHIALVLDMDSGNDRYFIAMQYVPGASLDKLLAEDGPLAWADVVRLAEQIGGALAFAHARGFIHRDVKPANIIRTPEGDFVLTDFGLTRAMMSTGLTSHTGAVLGTPAYIAPEIWQGETATAATDEYALACVLVEALTNEVLFAGESPPAVMTRHVLTGAELPETWPDSVPEDTSAVFSKALAKAPDARHGGPEALVAALQGAGSSRQEAGGRRQEARGKDQARSERLQASSVRHPASGNELILELGSGVEMVFVRIPAGEFLMGEGGSQRKVYLDEYWMGKYPVTNAQYAAFVEATGYQYPKGDEWSDQGLRPGRSKYPVVCVSMHDADAFCEWATQVTGHVIQLPTEAQWEKAARGTDGRTYPWGDEEPTHHHCTFNSGGTTQVGLHSPLGDSPYGCADMAGNVWEWCGGGLLRGGSWISNGGLVLGASRGRYDPPDTGDYDGFRCVLVAAPGG